jgi:ABC-2 type transport system permease protein
MMISPGIFKLSLRQLVDRHRLWLLAFLSVLAVIPTLIGAIGIYTASPDESSPDIQRELRELFSDLTIGFILPVIALMLSATILREEIQTQTIHYLLLKPISRTIIILSKWSAAMSLALVLSALSALGLAILSAESAQKLPYYLATGFITTLAYGGFFFFWSLVLDRALIAGFLFIILWEGIIGDLSNPARLLSIRFYAKSIERMLLGQPQSQDLPMLQSALTLAAVVVLALIFAGWRLSRMEFPGNSD